MAKWHGISRRKPSGGRLKRPNRYRGKRKTEISSENQFAYVGEVDKSKAERKLREERAAAAGAKKK